MYAITGRYIRHSYQYIDEYFLSICCMWFQVNIYSISTSTHVSTTFEGFDVWDCRWIYTAKPPVHMLILQMKHSMYVIAGRCIWHSFLYTLMYLVTGKCTNSIQLTYISTGCKIVNMPRVWGSCQNGVTYHSTDNVVISHAHASLRIIFCFLFSTHGISCLHLTASFNWSKVCIVNWLLHHHIPALLFVLPTFLWKAYIGWYNVPYIPSKLFYLPLSSTYFRRNMSQLTNNSTCACVVLQFLKISDIILYIFLLHVILLFTYNFFIRFYVIRCEHTIT